MAPVRTLAIAFALFAASAASALADEKPIEIPLKHVWAYQMPGTRDVRELEPERFGEAIKKLSSEEQLARSSGSLTTQILNVLEALPKNKRVTDSSFAVIGTGREALEAACEVLAHDAKTLKSFSPSDEITIVFFTREYGAYVHLHDVRRIGHSIEISYQFVPHMTKEMTRHFALIPIGRMSPGRVNVKILRMPFDKKFSSWGIKAITDQEEARLVSRPFEFLVKEARQP